MELLAAIFQKLLSMALTALPVMAVVLAVRACLKKAPKKYSYVLWLAVGLRLACPLLPESPVGLPQPEAPGRALSEMISHQAFQAVEFPKATGQDSEAAPAFSPEAAPDKTAPTDRRPAATAAPAAENGRSMGWMEAAALVWLVGFGGMLAYIAASGIRLRRRLDGAVLREDNVWECDGIPTPFVLGLFRPRIYIPFRMAEEQRLYVLAHERHHIRRRDHWAKALALLLLAAYWWDGAAWLCWRLFCRDMEMSCDEAVLARLGDRAKREYSLSLVSFALERQAPMALAFGEHDAARRVKNVLNWKKARPAVTFLALAAVALAIAVCGTNAPGGWVREQSTRDGGYMTYQTAGNTAGVSWYLDIYEDGVLTGTRYLGGAEDGPQTGAVHIDYQVSERMTSRGRELDSVQLYGEGDIPWDYEFSLDPDSHYDIEPESRRPLRGKTARRVTVPEGGLAVYALCLSETGKFTEELLENPLVLQVRLAMPRQGNSWLRVEQNGSGVSFSYELREPVCSWAIYEDIYENGTQVSSRPCVMDMLQEYGGVSPRDLRMTLDVPAVYAEGEGFAGTLEVHLNGVGGFTWNTTLPGDHYTGMGSVLGDGESPGRRKLTGDGSAVLYTVLLSTRPDGGISLGGTAGDGLLKNDTVVQYRFVTSTRPLSEWEMLADGQSGPLGKLARTLYAGRGDPEALLAAMEDFEEPLGRWELQEAAGNYLSLLFYDSPVAVEKRSTLMWRYSMVLLALLDDYAATTWNWIDGGVQARTPNDGLWNTDPWLHAHGLSGTIRDYGASPQAVETLLEALYPQSGGGAPVSELGASLFALRGETALLVKAIPERLIGLEGWDLTADGVLELLVSGTMKEIAGGEGRMSDASCLLAALLPEEVWAIRWMVDGRPVQFSYVEDHDPGGDLFTESTAFIWTEHRSGGGLYVRACGRSAAGMTLLLDALGIGGESLPVQTAEAFTDILGHGGFLWQEQWGQGGWSLRTYYAVTAEGTFPIAESFGWGGREDYSVDLDGDGQEELVCNVTFNADGARRAYVYQRRDDGIWQSCVTPEGLPGYENAGIGSSWEEYDPAENLFRIHYHKKGQEDYAVAEIRGMEQMEAFYPYS